jgi:hypothetical protein
MLWLYVKLPLRVFLWLSRTHFRCHQSDLIALSFEATYLYMRSLLIVSLISLMELILILIGQFHYFYGFSPTIIICRISIDFIIIIYWAMKILHYSFTFRYTLDTAIQPRIHFILRRSLASLFFEFSHTHFLLIFSIDWISVRPAASPPAFASSKCTRRYIHATREWHIDCFWYDELFISLGCYCRELRLFYISFQPTIRTAFHFPRSAHAIDAFNTIFPSRRHTNAHHLLAHLPAF